MAISKNVISQFVKSTNDTDKTTKKETFVRGMLEYDESSGQYCVRIYGSDILTPVTVTTNVNTKQPVTVMIKNHSATVIGNTATATTEESDTGVVNSTDSLVIGSIPKSEIDDLWRNYNS